MPTSGSRITLEYFIPFRNLERECKESKQRFTRHKEKMGNGGEKKNNKVEKQE